jgi:hypothetical protein
MRRVVKVALGLGAALAIISGGFFLLLKYVLFGNSYDRFETILAQDVQGRLVRSEFEACTTIGTVTEESLDLVSQSGRRETFMRFVPWGGSLPVKEPVDPKAIWVTPTELRISIGTVECIAERRDEVDGIHVTYDIALIHSKCGS